MIIILFNFKVEKIREKSPTYMKILEERELKEQEVAETERKKRLN